ncbi:MAG: 30S ribosomal protein S9 [Verrucomicrobia bacterium]|nr:30S ribosomal protein S9 [Verrucomicrobiota bacterium]NDE63112.1 30S ribosomal protein S9 [Chlamydiota bacterium]
MQKLQEVVAIGRRKTAVASVRLRPATKNEKIVNDKKMEEYFPIASQVETALSPLKLAELLDKYDIFVRVCGGGLMAQAEAVRLGVARAILLENEFLRAQLKAQGYLRRDPRRRERKKYGQRGARRRFQYSKR